VNAQLRFLVCLVALIGLTAPVLGKTFVIDTAPVKQGRISINGKFYGVAPVEVKLKIKRNQVFVATAEKAGALSIWPREFGKKHKGTVVVRLEADEAYRATIESDVANNWLTVTPRLTRSDDGSIDEDLVWQKIVSLVTDNFSDLEQMDRQSYYLRTAWRLRTYPYSVVRHRLVIKKGVTTDFSIKIKLESEYAVKRGNYRPSEDSFSNSTRVFQSDKETIDFLRDQL